MDFARQNFLMKEKSLQPAEMGKMGSDAGFTFLWQNVAELTCLLQGGSFSLPVCLQFNWSDMAMGNMSH